MTKRRIVECKGGWTGVSRGRAARGCQCRREYRRSSVDMSGDQAWQPLTDEALKMLHSRPLGGPCSASRDQADSPRISVSREILHITSHPSILEMDKAVLV
jgi:hypothetical protein